MINHLVGNELAPSSERVGDKEFCEMVGVHPETVKKYRRVKVDCKACDWNLITVGQLPKSCQKCGGEVEYRPLNPEFYQALQAALKEAHETNDFYGLRLRQWGLEQLHALYGKARTPTEKQKILSQILAQTADAVPFTGAVDYSHIPDTQLVEIALNRMDNTLESAVKARLLELSKGA